MLNIQNQMLCCFVLNTYGPAHQLIKLNEEMAELNQEACKILLSEGPIRPTEHFREELADVAVMLQQAIMMFGISKDEINLRAMEKLKRAIKRSGDYYGVSNKADYPSEAEDKEKFPADNEGRE